jgi:dienelactone hydrolase
LSVLLEQEDVVPERAGVAGHSYGGTTALYHAAVDDRCRFAGVSGALCSFEARQSAGTGINMFEVVPGISNLLDAGDLVEAIAPRPLLIVSATDDPYSADADRVVAGADSSHVSEIRVEGPHDLDPARFDAIVSWVAEQASLAT